MKDKNKYKKEVYKIIFKKYKESNSRLEKKEIKKELYNDPNLSEKQKNDIWSEIIQLEYLVK